MSGTFSMEETEPGTEAEAPGAPTGPGRHRRRTLLLAAAVVTVAAVAVVGALGLGGGGDESPGAPPRAGSTVQVTRGTLTERTTVDGQLGYGAEIPLPVKATGTVTWLPEPGTTVARGEELLRVDDRPVVLLYGTLPMYRELGLAAPAPQSPPDGSGGGESRPPKSGSSGTPETSGSPAPGGAGTGGSGSGTGGADGGTAGTGAGTQAPREPRGMDVMQFETNLAALGHTGFTVDERFTAGTARAVKRWQKSLGLPQTGTVGVGDVIYSSGTVRIGQAGVRLGSAVGENVLTYTGTARKVVVNASAREASWAVRGTAVTVELPDGRPVKGKVVSVGKAATAPEGGGGEGGPDAAAPTIPVTVAIEDQKSVGQLESGPVSVEYVGRERKDVLTVPVAALVALAEGGHGLETTDGTFVAVKTGLFADGKVEVSGPAVREGMKVRIPQ
ncbi:peptidoglycan-binding domain-containing protein [Streptomyces sp. NPDC006551]|uniref:peptidoglycan-binding domain-containing protein n=1 Tax=Streptomyces sp. NPDC006551 TaxID=3157178 RepID=UPI0033ADEBBA